MGRRPIAANVKGFRRAARSFDTRRRGGCGSRRNAGAGEPA